MREKCARKFAVECRDPSAWNRLDKPGRHVPTPPPNTEFNSVLKYGLKMRLSPKLTPIILVCGGFKGWEGKMPSRKRKKGAPGSAPRSKGPVKKGTGPSEKSEGSSSPFHNLTPKGALLQPGGTLTKAAAAEPCDNLTKVSVGKSGGNIPPTMSSKNTASLSTSSPSHGSILTTSRNRHHVTP